MKMIDLTGLKFGRWTVVKRGENTPQGQARWVCRCECGSEKSIKSIVIRRGLSQSCGCRKLEMLNERSTKHGHANSKGVSPTYASWAGMVNRCTNPNEPSYVRYGARGISVCERWLSFANFLADMGEKPAGMSIDRINNDGHYEPSNCRWADHKQQARNKSNNRLMTLNGVTRTQAEWCEILGLKQATVNYRLGRGYSDTDALKPPKSM